MQAAQSMRNLAIGNSLLALRKDSRLPRHVCHLADNLLVPVYKSIQSIGYIHLVAERLNQLLRAAQIVPRDARIEMVNGLELQASVEEIQPGGTIHVHGCSEHLLGERLGDTHVRSAHCEVGEGDLDVERGGDGVGDHDEGEAVPGARDGLVDDEVAVPGPEEDLSDELEVAEPPGLAFLRSLAEQKVYPT